MPATRLPSLERAPDDRGLPDPLDASPRLTRRDRSLTRERVLDRDRHARSRFRGAVCTDYAPDEAAFCRFTQQGFLRLATNPSVFGKEAIDLDHAWGVYDSLRNDERVTFAPEPVNLETHWRVFTARQSRSHRVWSDAYLAAFARCADMELVTGVDLILSIA